MRALLLITILLPNVAWAEQSVPRPAPQGILHTCIPTALLERLLSNTSRQPWNEVSQIMDQARAAAPGFSPCEPPVPPAAPAPDAVPAR